MSYEVHKYAGNHDYMKWTIHLYQANEGWEYEIMPAIFEGRRKANNEIQALEFAKQDCDTNGDAHGWRARGEGAPGTKEAEEMEMRLKLIEQQRCERVQKSLMQKSFLGRVRRSWQVLLGKDLT